MTDRELLHVISGEYEILIFGHGIGGIHLYNEIIKNMPDLKIHFCDNAKERQGKYEGYEVFSVENAVDLYKNVKYLITSSLHSNLMSRQLMELGVAEANIIYAATDEVMNLISQKKRNPGQPLEEIQFEINVVEHCNLKCKCCSQFSCITEEEYINLETMERDLRRMSNLFNGTCKHIYLIGGEPLLHPQIIQCMKLARTYFPKGKIYVYTNGLLLLKQNTEFWESCRKYAVSVIMTKYPIPLDHDAIVDKVQKEGIEFSYSDGFGGLKTMNNMGIDLDGKQNFEYSFMHCQESNKCIKLKDGKLYTCSVVPAIYKFNHYFNQSLEVTKNDYIDIYKVMSGKEILHELAKPIPFCRYCNRTKRSEKYEWGQTKGDIHEWIMPDYQN